ncbi:hypothetical protein ACFB49_16820 [Sphingomonas sp. DBB INV C78]|uniref:TIR domain-containing protein n=1 Tax=Sphingomonas sp. DBB INV C78 TaxID=3349434 RepID=UPI0036D34B28
MANDAAPSGSNGAPATVFVSYSRDDQKQALPIIRLIEESGYSVWWDGLLGGGERYSQTTAAALENAAAVVVLWSNTSVASHWVHDEATRARDRKRIIPVSIDGVPPPLGFGQFQTIDLSRAKLKAGDPAVQNLLRTLALLHDQPVTSAQPTAPAAKPIDRRIFLGGGVLLAAVGTAVVVWVRPFVGDRDNNSVAVLPFANLSGDPGQSYFSDGVAAEVRSELAQNPLLQVAAQTSSAKFAARQEDAKTIARKLGVAHLLDGNVRKSGNVVRVSVELTEGATGFSKWSKSFERPLADVFAVQDEIANAVTAALSSELTKGGAKGAVGGTENFAAYDAYLRGNALYQLSSGEQSGRDALAQYDDAIAKDPRYAAAWAARSRTLASIANQYLDGAARKAMFDDAIESAKKSLSLAANLADGHSALGYATLFGRRDARAAREPFERSAQLGQGASDVLTRYALYCARTGAFEKARTAIARAAMLDPLNPLAQRSVGTVEYTARRYPEAIAAFEKALILNPQMSGTPAAIGFSQLMLGQTDLAAKSFARESSALRRLTGVAMVKRKQGHRPEADAALAEIVREFGNSALYEQAQILAQWGDRDRAMATLMKANETGDPGLVLIRTDPLIDPLRNAPGFAGLLRQRGFE